MENSSLLFEVNVPDISVPLIIDFRLANDPSKGSAVATVGEILNNSVAVNFYNVIRNGPSGLLSPLSVVAVNGVELEMQFHIERNINAPTFLIYYAFYETATKQVDQA